MLNRRLDMILEAERPTVTVASNRNQEPGTVANSKTQSLYRGIPSKKGSQKGCSGVN
jgi:hypothetical protein